MNKYTLEVWGTDVDGDEFDFTYTDLTKEEAETIVKEINGTVEGHKIRRQ